MGKSKPKADHYTSLGRYLNKLNERGVSSREDRRNLSPDDLEFCLARAGLAHHAAMAEYKEITNSLAALGKFRIENLDVRRLYDKLALAAREATACHHEVARRRKSRRLKRIGDVSTK